jgi:hypothetical protein
VGKKNWIIDPITKKRKLDKRTPYAALKDAYASVDRDRAALAEQVIDLNDEVKHEQARNGEIFEQLVAARIELRELKRDFVELGIAHGELKVKLARADLDVTKLLGDLVIEELK